MADAASQNIQKLIAEQDWDDLAPRLLAYALREIKRWTWQGARGRWRSGKECLLPGGMGPQDLVNMAVAKVLGGERRWDPDRQPNFLEYLMGVIKSDISTILNGEQNRKEVLDAAANEGEDEAVSIFDKVPVNNSAIRVQLELENEEYAMALHDHLADSPELQKIVDFILEGDTKPSEFAERLGVPVEKVYNLKKQLQRRVGVFRKSWEKKVSLVEKGGRQ